jgi:hypothetical protein
VTQTSDRYRLYEGVFDHSMHNKIVSSKSFRDSKVREENLSGKINDS